MRFLIIGCGCRGLMIARTLLDRGDVVRGTTRNPGRMPELEAAGVEPFVGDPDRVGTLMPALRNVGVVCILLGSAVGDPEQLAALHGSRLEMLLSRVIDTTVRGVVYEAAGSAPADALEHGAELVRARCAHSRISYALVRGDPADRAAWLDGALAALDSITTKPIELDRR